MVRGKARESSAGGHQTHAEAVGLSAFIADKASTRSGYDASWRLWLAYLAKVEGEGITLTPYLDGLPVLDKERRLGHFIQHLYDTKLRGQQIRGVMSNVKMVFLESLESADCFQGLIVKRVKQAAGLTEDEKTAKKAKCLLEQSLPCSMDIILSLRGPYWSDLTWLCPDMDRRMVYLAVSMGQDSGARISNLTHRDGYKKVDHCIRARHVIFFFLVDGSIRSAMGGQPFRIAMAGCSDFPACVVKCEYRFMTGKIDMPEAFHTLGRRSPESCRARSKADC
jgi:hypothetical protein